MKEYLAKTTTPYSGMVAKGGGGAEKETAKTLIQQNFVKAVIYFQSLSVVQITENVAIDVSRS